MKTRKTQKALTWRQVVAKEIAWLTKHHGDWLKANPSLRQAIKLSIRAGFIEGRAWQLEQFHRDNKKSLAAITRRQKLCDLHNNPPRICAQLNQNCEAAKVYKLKRR